MSGGFFRGTSADQDTRFSNKQAKLLKSQKFAPELEHLVDMTKVKMDVMRPWIANRVTELIGFEDEVLVNFIYSLLDGKEVNGKEVQISLTGFMERNTGKFMKELWALLLSAQNNASGVPQQFLDAKEEETKKKKAESDRIANEIQRKREKEIRELEQERNKKMDAGNDIPKGTDASREPGSKHLPRASRDKSADDEPKERNGSRGRNMVYKSPISADHSASPRRMRSRSVSKSFSNSRSYSNERRRSRSLSASPKRRERSSSSEMVRRSSPKRSLTPRRRHSPRRYLTPPRRRSSYSRRHISPSPTRYRMRSPRRRRSRSPLVCRSRSPIRHWSRSPIRRSLPRNRSRSPVRPSSSSMRRRSPSLSRRRSPSPMRNTSPSPMRRRYRGLPLSPKLRPPSPVRRRSPMPRRRRSPSPANRRSPSSQDWSSPSPFRRRSPLPIRRRSPKRPRSPVESPRRRKRDLEKDSPVRHASPRAGVRKRSKSLERRSQDDWDGDDNHRKVKGSSYSARRSPVVSEDERNMSPNEDRRSSGPLHSPGSRSNAKITSSCSLSPLRKSRDCKPRHDSSERSADDKDTNYLREGDKMNHKVSRDTSKTSDQHKHSHGKDSANELSLKGGGHHPVETQSHTGRIDSNMKAEVFQGGHRSGKIDHLKKSGHEELQIIGDKLLSRRERESPVKEGCIAVEKNQSCPNDIKINDRHYHAVPKSSSRKVEQKDHSSEGSGSEESDKNQSRVGEKRKNKRSERQGSESEDESSYDSYEEERREAKRRRKEEKRSRKEEKRRRREERRRKKEERRAEKRKLKSTGAVSSPSDVERYDDGRSDDDQHVRKRQSRRSNVQEMEPEQKKLEIELREKALENLRAKKGIGH